MTRTRKKGGSPIEPELNSREYWEQRFGGSWHEHNGPRRTLFYAQLLHDHLPGWVLEDIRQKQMDVCDWGCAEGEAVGYFGQLMPANRVVGVDFAETAIAMARKKFPKHEFSTRDWLTENSGLPRHDVIMTSHVLEHFNQPVNILRDLLGRIAQKYIVVLVPFAENPRLSHPEHQFRFLLSNLPLTWDDWSCVYCEVIDPADVENTMYGGQQILVVYGKRSWITQNRLELTLANLPVETHSLKAKLEKLDQLLEMQKNVPRPEAEVRPSAAQIQELSALQQENTSLREQIQSLELQHVKLSANRTQLEQFLESLQQKEKELVDSRSELELQNSRLVNEKNSLESAVKHHLSELEQERTQLALLTSENATLKQRNLEAEAQLNFLTSENAALKDLNSEGETRLSSLTSENSSLRDRNSQAEAQIASLVSENALLENRNSEVETSLSSLTSENSLLRDGNSQAEAQIAFLVSENTSLRDRNLQAEAELAGALGQLEENRAAFDSSESEKAMLKEQKLILKSQLSASLARLEQEVSRSKDVRSEYEEMKSQRSIFESELAGTSEQLDVARKKAAALEQENKALTHELRILQENHAHLEREKAAIQHVFGELSETAHGLRESLKRADEENKRLSVDISGLQKRCTVMWERGEQYRFDKDRAEAHYQDLQDRWKQEQARFEQLLIEKNEADQLAARLSEECSKAEEQDRQQNETITKIGQRVVALEELRDSLKKDIASLQSDNDHLKIRNKHLFVITDRLRREQIRFDELRKELEAIKSGGYYRFTSVMKKAWVALGLSADPEKPLLIEAPPEQPSSATKEIKDIWSVGGAESESGRPLHTLRIGAIMDDFTRACISPECDIVTFGPDNWQSTLEEQRIDLLFVESAWNGNGGAWQYRIGTYPAVKGHELPDLVEWCRNRGIPTVFWNKEDPPHFEKFILSASRFDYLFTTDANCIERYRKICPNMPVAALPFAAQPRIHNPILEKPRDGNVCFAGTFYADMFEPRARELEVLLRGARDFGLDIYDRMYDLPEEQRRRYLFPEDLRPFIRGKLDYQEMLKAHKRYNVFLNVNSVSDSPTMFSRRVFELLASGTTVISAPSIGVDAFFGDIVPQVGTEEEVQAVLASLLGDTIYRMRTAARGVRSVMTNHTYEIRLKNICDIVGIATRKHMTPACVVACGPVGERTIRDLRWQSEQAARVFVPGQKEIIEPLLNAGINATAGTLEEIHKLVQDECSSGIVIFMNGRNAYGPNYIRDARLAVSYSGRIATGMTTFFAMDKNGRLKVEDSMGAEHFLSDNVLSDTLVMTSAALTSDILSAAVRGGKLKLPEPAYSRSRFEFIADCQTEISRAVREAAFIEE